MATSNRADKITHVYKILKKHFKPVSPPQRSVLEHLLYACCLENVSYEKADQAFERIQGISFDWNEVRVTSAGELGESMTGFPEPRRSAATLRRILQSVFESQYSYDLEHLKKQNLGKTVKDLEKYSGTSPFIVSYVTQHALGGHSIPVDRGALDVMFIADVVDEKERGGGAVPGLERAISKKQGIEFGSLLHQLAAELVASPFSTSARAILMEINPDGKDRLPKRKSRKKKASPPEAKKPKDAKASTAKVAKKKTAKTPVAKKVSRSTKVAKSKPTKAKKTVKKTKKATKKTSAKKSTKKPAVKKKTATKKKSPTKNLAKRKPR